MSTPTPEEQESLRRIIARGSYQRTADDKPYADVADRILAAGYRKVTPITEDMVERAAEAMMQATYGEGAWEYREPMEDILYRVRARSALEAALGEQPDSAPIQTNGSGE